jgi:hypothetical protein
LGVRPHEWVDLLDTIGGVQNNPPEGVLGRRVPDPTTPEDAGLND